MARLRILLFTALPLVAAVLVSLGVAFRGPAQTSPKEEKPRSILTQTDAEALAKSTGCVACHEGIEPMHESKLVKLGCVDCHGGCPTAATKEGAHVAPRHPEAWPTSANPVRSFTLLNHESPEFIQFVNPGDWRIAFKSCGLAGCHEKEVAANPKSIMGHSAMVPGSALYNNGSVPIKIYRYGDIYGENGVAQRAFSTPRPTLEDVQVRGVLPFLDPLPRFEITQPGNIFRVLEINNNATSVRGRGTGFRTDAVFLNLQKTKLNDPTMCFLGTNDHPGDYRSSGCTSCHVPYANDRDPAHSAYLAAFGNRGHSASDDPAIPHDEPGHPVKHRLTRQIPSSQCVSCHFHQGSGASGNYFGYQWWDYESDALEIYSRFGKPGLSGHVGGAFMAGFPGEPRKVGAPAAASVPPVAMLTGVVGGPKNKDMPDLAPEVNPHLHGNQFADYQNSGWPMQAVFKRDRKGRLLDANGQVVPESDPDWHKRAVHLADIHMEKGMHCVDCHFYQDNHGNGKIYGAMIDEVEINCKDCHGTVAAKATLRTSNANGGNDLAKSRTPFGELRFLQKGERLFQRSSVTKGVEWEVVQVKDVVTPGSPHYSEAGRLAKTIQRDGRTWGHVPQDHAQLAHTESSMTCYACHSSWNNTCSGCHLDAQTNLNTPSLHYEGEYSKVYAAYNPEALRTDGFTLGVSGSVQGHKVAPVRSASGVIVSARDGNRAMVLHQQPTISAEGFSGHAFTPNVPHTVRGKETRQCTDCHISAADDNNAMVAQVLGLGIHATDMIGRYAWVAERGRGLEAVRVTAGEEFPQPVVGSDLHKVLDPPAYDQHQHNGRKLCEAYHHHTCDARCVQRYYEWVLVADGSRGLRVYDAANIANKNVAQRLIESPLSPLGQWLHLPSRDATWVALASVLPVDAKRSRRPENEEQAIHPLLGYAFVTDCKEGLIVVDIHTLIDGDPSNNFLRRAATFNPGGLLDGAVRVRIAGTRAYVLSERSGLIVLDVSNPCTPQVVAVLGAPDIVKPRSIDIQFRYAFICDCEGLKVVDITCPDHPLPCACVPLCDARDVKVMRTYAYVAAGSAGLAIIDVETPPKPGQAQFYNAGGCINDASAVVTGATYASLYAYLGDGKNGLRVIQLVTPANGSDALGFSPMPHPCLIATYPTRGPAVALSEGLPRDRFVDEDGNQICVFGRRGSRPFNCVEMRKMYLRDGELYTVTDAPPGKPSDGPVETLPNKPKEKN